MPPAPRPQWQQATALITIGAGSIATGLSVVPTAAADLTTPASIPPVTLLALEHANAHAPGKDAMLRAAIVHMARHFLRLAQTRSPAEMEAMIWQYASTDGANHGPSCGAFASLTLELGSHIAGVDSWVTGGTSYPWPVHSWVDGRVDPNPASPGVVSILQDAQSHGRWHSVGDGYVPQPGDWVLFDGHVEVVTKYHGGVLHTIGGDSLPNLSVNAHEYAGALESQGVAGFVDNGVGMSNAPGRPAHPRDGGKHGAQAAASHRGAEAAPRMASAAPSPPGWPASSTGPASSADPMSHGAASGHRARGGAASGGAPSAGAAHGRAARSGAASSAGPVTTAADPAQQSELEPRAFQAPPTAPRSRFAQESGALPAQGAMPAPPGERTSAAAGPARAAEAARAAAAPRHQNGAGKQAPAAGRAWQPAYQPSQHAGQSKQRPARTAQHGERSPHHRAMTADVPATGLRPAGPHHARPGEAAIPGLFKRAHHHHPANGAALAPYHRHDVPPSKAPLPGTATQQAFINEVANGAMANQHRYGVPASVTIAQAIDESGWGQSLLATNDHNLFGIKGTGPAGSDQQPTQEVINGQLVNLSASFQIYRNIAQSIDAHGRLLAHSGDYASAMAQSKDPNAFAAALTGVYATDPSYGAKLIQLMQQYDLYRFDRAATRGAASGTGGGSARAAQHPARAARQGGTQHPGGAPHPAHTPPPPPAPGAHRPSPGRDRKPTPQRPGPIGNPVPVQPAPLARPVPGQPAPIANPDPMEPGPTTGPHSAAHDPKPARATKTGRSIAAHHGGASGSAQAADHAQGVHHNAVTPPAAVLYPGRSARPAPLAHPARPTDLARPSSPAPRVDPGATSAPTQAQLPGLWPGPASATGRSSAAAGRGRPGGHASPGSATGPASGAGLGQAQIPGDAGMPGVPRAVTPHAAWPPGRRPISRLRPAHPAGRPTQPIARAQNAGPKAPGNVGHGNGDAQRAAAPAAQPPNSGPNGAHTPHRIVPAASASTVSPPGSAMIPGLQHHDLGAPAAAGLSGGASGPDSGRVATARSGGSSIPGAQQGFVPGSASQAPPAGSAAAAPSHQPAASTGPAPAPSRPHAVASHPPTASSRTRVSASYPAPGSPAAAPGQPAAGRPDPAAAPRQRAAAGPAAPGVRATASSGYPAAGTSHASAGGSAQPGRSPAAPSPGAANPVPAPVNQAPEPGTPVPAPANPVPAPANPVPAAARPVPTAASTPAPGGADVPGLVRAAPAPAQSIAAVATAHVNGGPAGRGPTHGGSSQAPAGSAAGSAAPAASAGVTLTAYHAHMPPSVRQAFITSAKMPLTRAEQLYRDVASHTGIRWEILAACDWMQCRARQGYSPVYGEKLGALNPDDTCYRTKSAALEQCASDLVQLARSVYRLDIATSHELSVRDLANVFAAYRWGGLLRQHCTSAMDFPYSVAGLTADHTHMRWPNIDEPNAPDKPGSRFRQHFGAVPVVLSLNYQAFM